MVKDDGLIEGKCYFTVEFFDNKMVFPDIVTYIYVGKNLLADDDGAINSSWYFQDVDSYIKHGIFLNIENKKDREVLLIHEYTLEMIYDISGLVEILLETKERN